MAPGWTTRVNWIHRRYFVIWLFKVVSSAIRRIWPAHGQDRSVVMTLQKLSTIDAPRHIHPEHTPRLRLKPKAPRTGYVDGAWWPHSDDLKAQLPDLLAVLSVRLGPIDRVLFNVNEWAKSTAETHHRRASGTARRISTSAGQHRRSHRSQPQQNRLAGSAAELRPGRGARHPDGRREPERRVNC